MGDVLNFPGQSTRHGDVDMLGGCPYCHRYSGMLNIGSEHWLYCERHQVKWRIGSDLFSGWRDEPGSQWRRNAYKLAPYRVVEPWFPL